MLAVLEGLGYPRDSDPRSVSANLSRVGIGISDNYKLAQRLSQLFQYTNTFFHQFPIVDVTAPPPSAIGAFEFVVCSDVLEHVPPPAEKALSGLRSVLRENGFTVVSVPCGGSSTSIEHYPGVTSWQLDSSGLTWTDERGFVHSDPNPELHGGEGQTLAFRTWSYTDLIDRLTNEGFSSVTVPSSLPPMVNPPDDLRSLGLFIARA